MRWEHTLYSNTFGCKEYVYQNKYSQYTENLELVAGDHELTSSPWSCYRSMKKRFDDHCLV